MPNTSPLKELFYAKHYQPEIDSQPHLQLLINDKPCLSATINRL